MKSNVSLRDVSRRDKIEILKKKQFSKFSPIIIMLKGR